METPDILNSKIKKLRIELPDYRFSHSSSGASLSGDSAHAFIGRARIKEKLKKIVDDSPDEPGVYLVAGNRGVGKTRLISEVIKETSLRTDLTFFKKLSNLFNSKTEKEKYNRLYLRINFGHKLRDEKDILRLIARTLSAEYAKYRRSLWRRLPWRAIAFGLLFLLASLFSCAVMSSEYLQGVFSRVNNNVEAEVETKVKTKVGTNVKTEVETNVTTCGGNRLSECARHINSFPVLTRCLMSFFLFLLSSFLMYIFGVLLFRSTWITHFFITHRVIARRLKKLNHDITHSTERENSLRVNSGSAGPVIGTTTRKQRNIADAREIEKELQDILDDMQHIPRFMCRPNVVIVFDELDKVEPGDASLEKEIPQTKATMFSIGATRERQTEILRILSNLKYFLSTARAKFIFIAGREMFDIHLADVSERNNYIGSIFNAVIHVPSFLTDHPTGKKTIREESTIASLPEEFVCLKLFPHDYDVETYNLGNYRRYLKEKIFCENTQDTKEEKDTRQEEIQKIIAVLQQFIIYLAHVSKGAPKKMMQLFESFVEIQDKKDNNKRGNTLFVARHDHNSEYFLSFNYYKQYTLGIIAYMITPIFYRLAESNIKEHSDKLLVSSLRFVDFIFKFHKHPFSWKHLDISPEMLEVNRAPELKSVAVDLLNYLAQVHLTKSNFSLADYKFDSLIANEIFAMTKTDEVFSALFSFSLDETLPVKKHYHDLLEKTEKEYKKGKRSSVFIDAISSLQVMLGDLYYYDDELEEAEVYYKNAVQALRRLEQKNYHKVEPNTKKAANDDEKMTPEQFYQYVRNMLRLGMIYERRKQYDFAYLTYGGLCNWIIRERNISIKDLGAGVVLRKDCRNRGVFVKASHIDKIDEMYYDSVDVPSAKIVNIIEASTASPQPLYFKNVSPNTNDALFKKMTFEGLKMLYLAFIAKLQILELSHIGGITGNHLEQLDREFEFLTYIVDHKDTRLLEAEFYSRVADILYYKNADLKYKKNKDRRTDKNEANRNDKDDGTENLPQNHSCTACYYYHRALSILLGKPDTVKNLLSASVKLLNNNYNVKYCTILARILSDWGNVFFSCDTKDQKDKCGCYIYDAADCNTQQICYGCACYICDIDTCETNNLGVILKKYINYVNSDSKEEVSDALLMRFGIGSHFTKMEIAFAMYTISSEAYRNANLYKRSAYQIYKMLDLFKHYEIYSTDYIKQLSEKAIHYLWYANEDLGVLELNKRKKDFNKTTINDGDEISLQSLLVDTEITRIRILVKELELKSVKKPEDLKKYYDLRITSPYKINYSVVGRIYRLRLKSMVNYETYQQLLGESETDEAILSEIKLILIDNDSNDAAKKTFGEYFDGRNDKGFIIEVLENLIAETIYCLIDIVQLTKTMGETYLFPHSFLGLVHEELSLWIRRYETYEMYIEEDSFEEYKPFSQIKKYLKKYLDDEWRELLSGYRENQQALSHYYKCLEMHSDGRAYHEKIDTMCYVRDDYNDRSDHFNIAEERHLIVNGKIQEKIDKLKEHYAGSKLYKVDNYYNKVKGDG